MVDLWCFLVSCIGLWVVCVVVWFCGFGFWLLTICWVDSFDGGWRLFLIFFCGFCSVVWWCVLVWGFVALRLWLVVALVL